MKPISCCLWILWMICHVLVPVYGQSSALPSMGDLEAQHGSLVLTAEVMVALEVARLEKDLQTGDALSFANGFADDDDKSFRNGPVHLMAALVTALIKVMRKRKLHDLDNLATSSTFDFVINNVSFTPSGKKIVVSGMLAFTYLQEVRVVNGDTLCVPVTKSFRATYHKKKRRWKITRFRGIADFFLDVMEKVDPGSVNNHPNALPWQSLKTGYPALPANTFNLEDN